MVFLTRLRGTGKKLKNRKAECLGGLQYLDFPMLFFSDFLKGVNYFQFRRSFGLDTISSYCLEQC